MLHVTYGTWRELNILSKVQVPILYGFGVNMVWRFGGKGLLTELINFKGVCRAAPAVKYTVFVFFWVIITVQSS